MAAEETLTWDILAADGGPRRPSLEDLGGATLEDDTIEPPDPETMPYAAQLNQWAKQIEGIGAVVPSLIVSVTFSGSTPQVHAFAAPSRTLVLSDLTPTDNGTGDTTITWPADALPPEATSAEATINQDVGAIVGHTVVSVTNGVRVRTYDASGARDLNFTVVRR